MTTPTALPAGLTTGTWTIDPSHSEVGFTVRHLMVSKVRGRFADVTGQIVVSQDPTASVAEATIAIASVDTRDAKRDEHLRSPDFFDAAQFPEMTFRSTGIRPDGSDYLLDGDLTIKGVTKQVTLQVEVGGVSASPFGTTVAGFSASTEIDRTDFGLTWNAALETGGVMVSEKVKISLEIEVVKQES